MQLFPLNNHSFKTLLLIESKQTPSHSEDLKISMLGEHQHSLFKTSMSSILNLTHQTPSSKPRNLLIKVLPSSQSNPLSSETSPSRNSVTLCTSLITPSQLFFSIMSPSKTSMELALDLNLKISLIRPILSTFGFNSVPSKTVSLMLPDSLMFMRTQDCRLTKARSQIFTRLGQDQSF